MVKSYDLDAQWTASKCVFNCSPKSPVSGFMVSVLLNQNKQKKKNDTILCNVVILEENFMRSMV